jgi:hypothetical protein
MDTEKRAEASSATPRQRHLAVRDSEGVRTKEKGGRDASPSTREAPRMRPRERKVIEGGAAVRGQRQPSGGTGKRVTNGQEGHCATSSQPRKIQFFTQKIRSLLKTASIMISLFKGARRLYSRPVAGACSWTDRDSRCRRAACTRPCACCSSLPPGTRSSSTRPARRQAGSRRTP